MSGRRHGLSIGVFGGTFDPPHNGHLIVAQDAAIALNLDRVLFVPAAIPPHKQHTRLTSAASRARMLDLAIEGDDRFAIDRLELERPGPSWTVDTLNELATREPDMQWTLLIGADQYAEFESWRAVERIRELARIAVLARGAAELAAPGAATDRGAADVRIEVTRIDISGTAIRRRVADGMPIRYLVPQAVEQFIFDEKLYVRNGTTATG